MAKLTAKRDKARGWTAAFPTDSTTTTTTTSTSTTSITSITSTSTTNNCANNTTLHSTDILDAISEDQEVDLSSSTSFNKSDQGLGSGSGSEDLSSGDEINSETNDDDHDHDEEDEDEEEEEEEEDDEDDDDDRKDNNRKSSTKHANNRHRRRRQRNTSSGHEDEDREESEELSTTDESEEELDAQHKENNHEQDGHDGPQDIPKSKNGVRVTKRRPSTSALSTSPSDPSKIISATPTKKITKKSKKSTKSKSKGSLAASRQAAEEAKLEAAKPIVSRFMEMESTKLNDKLLQVFMINGMIPYVVGMITRLDPEIAKQVYADDPQDETMDGTQEAKFMKHYEYCCRSRDYSDLNLMKKSYTAMNFLVRNDMYNEFILSNSHQQIVKELFKIFRPESNGNFHHFHKVFDAIMKKFRVQTMATLYEDTDSETGQPKTPLILEMLPYLDQAPVSLSLMKALFPTYLYGISDKIEDYYKTLERHRFLEKLLAMTTLTEATAHSMGDIIVLLLDEVTRTKRAKIFLSCLGDDPIWAERLVRGVQSKNTAKRHSCIEIIYSILVRSIQMPFQDMFSNSNIIYMGQSCEKVESHMERIAKEFGNHLIKFIPELCHEFIDSQSMGGQVALPGHIVPTSFTVERLWLLDSIYHCLTDVKESPELLESIPSQFWATLVDSFFKFCFNSAYHVQFYKMFRVALYSEQATVYDRFFVQTSLVNRLIEHYKAPTGRPTGARGYIILILNCIRLSIDVEEQAAMNAKKEESNAGATTTMTTSLPGYWTELLKDNTEWQEFKPILRAATLEQTRDTLCHMDPHLRFQFAPLQARQPTEPPMTKRHFGIPGVSARGTDGIDLGSRYGNSLGFGVPMVYDRSTAMEDVEEAASKGEQEHESEVQKALANLMPSTEWRLLPPQRVTNTLNSNKSSKPVITTNGHNNNSSSSGNGSDRSSDERSRHLLSLLRASLGAKDASDDNGGVSATSPETASETALASGSGTTTAKSKKKKKNKKKRQLASVERSGGNGDEDGDDHDNNVDEDEAAQGLKRIAITSSEDDMGSSDSDSSSGTMSNPSSANNSDVSGSEDEGSGGSSGGSRKSSNGAASQNGTSSSVTTDQESEEEERRKERKREKKREKKRKSRMNKKNKIEAAQSHVGENSGVSHMEH
ncbi:hypothetical protein BGZ94_003697 [Podila epigama]|nr:hypothetical protein BGZ94_003697 [Podila epigama]